MVRYKVDGLYWLFLCDFGLGPFGSLGGPFYESPYLPRVKGWDRDWCVVLVVATTLCPGKYLFYSLFLSFPPYFYPPFGCCCPHLLLLVLLFQHHCPPPVFLLLLLSSLRYLFDHTLMFHVLHSSMKLRLRYLPLCGQLSLMMLWISPGPCPHLSPFLHIPLAAFLS